MKPAHWAMMILLALLLSACGLNLGDDGLEVRSVLQRETSPSVSTVDAQALLAGNTSFAFDFFQQVREPQRNLIFSPYSLSLGSAMLYAGAGGETASQIAQTLHFTLPPEQLHPALNALSLKLSKREAQSKKIDASRPMRLDLANAVWTQSGYPFEQAYLDQLALNYGAGLRQLDFSADPETSRQKINAWVERETDGNIKDILPPGSVDEYTRLVLANAIYFKAAWEEAFSKDLTRDAPFTLLDGSHVQVPTMQTGEGVPVRFASVEGYQAVALPYRGNLAEMLILLPDPGEYKSFESSLDAARYAAILDQLRPHHLKLYMPRFEFSSDFDLKQVLSSMGMTLAFDRDWADFSAMTLAERLYVQQARHQGYILTDEEGTKAAAASIFGLAPASAQIDFLHVDRPFIFVIRDVPTGAILFVGRVLNPLEK